MKTVLITGCSSDWSVIATMRTPHGDALPAYNRLRVLPLDVTDSGSIRHAVGAAGPIDVLVNNAGIGYMNALEGTPMSTVHDVFETNVFGNMAMIRAVLPQFRERRAA